MKNNLTDNKYGPILGDIGVVARASGCSTKYVSLLLRGLREIKSNNAKKAQRVFQKADELLKYYNSNN